MPARVHPGVPVRGSVSAVTASVRVYMPGFSQRRCESRCRPESGRRSESGPQPGPWAGPNMPKIDRHYRHELPTSLISFCRHVLQSKCWQVYFLVVRSRSSYLERARQKGAPSPLMLPHTLLVFILVLSFTCALKPRVHKIVTDQYHACSTLIASCHFFVEYALHFRCPP